MGVVMKRWFRGVAPGKRLGVRARLFLITGLVFAAMALTLTSNVVALRSVKVGGPLYEQIRDRQQSLEGFAQLRADLNQVRAELGPGSGRPEAGRSPRATAGGRGSARTGVRP